MAAILNLFVILGGLERTICLLNIFAERIVPMSGIQILPSRKTSASKKAFGDILILQCAEAKYTRAADIENLIRPLLRNKMLSVYAPTESLDQNGQMEKWMVGPGINPVHGGDGISGPEFLDLCQAVWRNRVLAIGGFDEAYKYYGIEDNDFSDRLYFSKVDRMWSPDVVVQHQWHGYNERMKQEFNSEWGKQQLDVARLRYAKNTLSWSNPANLVANRGRNWGDINS
jgi:N-terminal domain of galactosyltransferase